MKTMNAARTTLVLACIAVAASLAMAGSAFAATVHGADFHGSGSALESGEIDVLNVDGAAGETIFLSVERDGVKIAQNLPYTIGADAQEGDQSTWAGIATLDIAGLDLGALDGSYTIKAYADRAGKEELYSGAIYGVYADLGDGAEKLIGTRTANADEKKARDFSAPESIYVNGATYRLAGEPSGKAELHFSYEPYDEATTVDSSIKYLDAEGNVVATTQIPGIGYGEEVTVDVPDVVVAENGDLYRTVFFRDTITAKNPGAVSFSIYCMKISDADKALAGYYVATIKMVDEQGNVIATDSVDVTGNFVYTAPTVIYKKEAETSIGQPAVVTYEVEGSPTIYLSAATDNVVNHARTITVTYSKQDPDQPTVDVTYNLIDGSKRVGEAGRSLGTQSVTVTLDEPTAVPPALVEAEGATYNLVGDPSEYEYAIRSGEVPSINAYYIPEGYVAPGPYEVTVNYVNFLTDKVVESHSYTSDPNATGALSIEAPATFEADGVDYVRLDGQEDSIQHSYYSGISSYTVYYRDKNDTLSSGTVINTIRVVYRDLPAGEAAANAGAGANAANAAGEGGGNAAAGAGGAGDADNAGAAGGEAQNLQLNGGRTYNVFDGEGNNGSMTNESGVDSNTERIEDSETPLASGFDRGATSSAASSLADMAALGVPIGIGVVVVIAIAAAVLMFRRRASNDRFEA